MFLLFFQPRMWIFMGVLMASLMANIRLNAQNHEGIITYKYTLLTEEGSSFPGMPPTFDVMTKLHYTSDKTFFDRDKDAEEVIDPTDRRARWINRMMQNKVRSFYKNVEENRMIELVDLFGKKFIITDSLPQRKWKISAGEQKDILGYMCMKAMYKDSSENLIAYFTPQIPLPHGPSEFNGLPGIILEVQSADFHILAQAVAKEGAVISIPSDGENISREDFNKLREEKIKERQEMWGNRQRR